MTTPIWDVMNRPDVIALFTRQHFVASCAQLAEIGVTKFALHRARERGARVRRRSWRGRGLPEWSCPSKGGRWHSS